MTIYSFDVLFSQFETSLVPYPVLIVTSWPAYRFLRKQVKWSGTPISKNFPELVVIHTDKGFRVVNEAEIEVFQKLPCYLYDPENVGNLISGSSALSKPGLYIWKFSVMYCWSLTWRILSMTLLSIVKWVQLCGSLNILWHCPSLGLEWNNFSSPVGTAAFSEFAGILSAAL